MKLWPEDPLPPPMTDEELHAVGLHQHEARGCKNGVGPLARPESYAKCAGCGVVLLEGSFVYHDCSADSYIRGGFSSAPLLTTLEAT